MLGRQGSVNLTDQGILNVANTFYGSAVTWTVAVAVLAVAVTTRLLGRRRRAAAGLPLEPVWRTGLNLGIIAAAVIATALMFDADRGLLFAVCIFVGLVLVVDVVLHRSRSGRHVYAVGGNIEAARRAGIQVERVRLLVFVAASTLAAMGGILAASRGLSVSTSSGGNDVLLYAIAGAVIGGTSLFGGRGTAWSARSARS